MPRHTSKLVLAVFTHAVLFSAIGEVRASSPICLVGCVKADVAGITELAESLKEWARLLPQLNEEFHEQIRADLDKMDQIAKNLVDTLDKTYGKNLVITDTVVRSLIDHAIQKINEIGRNALVSYKKALFETDCQTVSLATIIKNNLKEVVPTFPWISSWFGSFNTLQTTNFSEETIEEAFDPDSASDRFAAAYKLLSRKLDSARDETEMKKVLDVALERQKLAYSYHCETRASIGSLEDYGHVYDYLQRARLEYRGLYDVWSFGRT